MVAELCRRLDGIPLAIELAAARLNVLSIEQIDSRLNDRFRLLTGGSRTAVARQRTLKATMDWSYDLLSDPERQLLRRLSVFAGGWTIEAAEKVTSEIASEREDVLDFLSRLVDKSLVNVDARSKRAGGIASSKPFAITHGSACSTQAKPNGCTTAISLFFTSLFDAPSPS